MIYDLSKMDEIEVHAISLSCVRSYVYYHESKYYQHITDSFLSQTEGKWTKAVKWFVSNSARAVDMNAKGFRISLDDKPYVGNKLGIGFRGVKSLLEWLEKKGYINIYKGYVIEWKTENGKRVPERTISSIVVLRPRALEMWDKSYVPDLWREMDEASAVEIRNRETKEEMSTKGKVGVKEVRKEMIGYNDSLQGADITFRGEPIADVQYKRVFLDSLHVAGRVYAQGGGVQLLPQHLRSEELKIDGEPVVELDFSAIHPNICYQLLYSGDGFNVRDAKGEDFSPYGADLSFISVNQKLKEEIEKQTGKDHNPLRQLAKLAILIGMNSVDKQSALGAMSSKILADRKKPKMEQDFYAITESIPVGKILDAIQEHNDFIGKKFFSDQGVFLQNIDSKIMMEIIGTMIQKGHTVLAYHDSCVVKASAENDLKEAMYTGWKEVLGDTTFCKVDKK
ncbi:hypothetical protein D3C85_344770 [compost metagenome]